jgi:hypothetical protein
VARKPPLGRADRALADAEAAAELLVEQRRDDLGELGEAGAGDADLAAALDGLGLRQAARGQGLTAATSASSAEPPQAASARNMIE